MEGFLLCLSKFLTEFLEVMLIMLLIQKSPHLIMIFVSAKLRLNSEKKKLITKKNNYNRNNDDNIGNDDNTNNDKNIIIIIIIIITTSLQ